MQIHDALLKSAKDYLVAHGFETEEAERESRFILAHSLNCSPVEIFFLPPEKLSKVEGKFWQLLKQRAKTRVPLAYLLGEVGFFGYKFKVFPGVLIPRPETEVLVEETLNLVNPGQKILELGVGTGCISLTLALKEPSLKVFGVELSPKALSCALKNRKRFKLEERVFFIRGDWLSPLKPQPNFHFIVSNPPYIAPEEWGDLSPEVKDFEPQLALLGGEEGLAFIERTLKEGPDYLLPGGKIILEIGYQQAEKVASLAQRFGYQFYFKRDLLGHRRVLVACKEIRPD